MIHLIYDKTIYLNVDELDYIQVGPNNNIVLGKGDNKTELPITTHPQVKKVIDSIESNKEAQINKGEMERVVCFKALEIILDRLASKDPKLPPIVNLESALYALQERKEGEAEEKKEAPEMIPVAVNQNGDITKVLKEGE